MMINMSFNRHAVVHQDYNFFFFIKEVNIENEL